MFQRILIVSGGSIRDDFAYSWIKQYVPEYIIAADSGMEFLRRVNIVPNMIIGDFDSVNPETIYYFKEKETIIWKELNPIKDDTDTEFAIRQAILLGTNEITILGGTGTRLDHVMGNIALLGIGLKEQVSIQLIDANNRIRMINKSFSIKKDEQFGNYISFLPYQGAVTHLYMKGFKYPLADFTLEPFNSLGISNEIVDEEAEVIFKEGVLLVIEARD